MTFQNGVYYSHYASPVVLNANTRVQCGQNTQAQNWAPIRLSVTDYGTFAANTAYTFRFPIITLPNSNNAPLTYIVRLIQISNNYHYPVIMNEYVYENLYQTTNVGNLNPQSAFLIQSTNYVQSSMTLTFNYNYYVPANGVETIIQLENDIQSALTSLSTLATSLGTGSYTYQYFPNINVVSYIKTTASNTSFNLGTYLTSTDQESFQIKRVYTYIDSNNIDYATFGGSSYGLFSVTPFTTWTTSSFTLVSSLPTVNSWGTYTIAFSSATAAFAEGSSILISIGTNLTIVDEYCLSTSGFQPGVNTNSNFVCKRYSTTSIMISGYAQITAGTSLSVTLYLMITQNAPGLSYLENAGISVTSAAGNPIVNAITNSISIAIS
ncbi:unnamed protein product [Sphagnum balticum]